MAKFLVTTKDVRSFGSPHTLRYYGFVGSAQAVARYLAENRHEVLIASLPVDDESAKILNRNGYTERS